MDQATSGLVDRLLPWFRAPGRSKTFVLGCFARRVTFSSQQTRACNLVLLLSAAGHLDASCHVCIIGAGLAGLTAAAMAVRAGARVTLIEQSSGPLSLQVGNFVRYIHPGILSWPEAAASTDATALPVLNWTAASAEHVAEQVLADWRNYSSEVDLITNCRAMTAAETDTGVKVTVEEAGRARELPSEFSLAILAVGFGLERNVKGIGFRSYWSNDALHQQFPVNNHRLRVLVSGTGDGGLIDTLRLKIDNFDHTKFVDRIYGVDGFEDIRQPILDIEKTIDADERASSRRLVEQYEALEPRIPSRIKENIFASIRQDVRVCLSGKLDNPADSKASALHRLTVFLIWRSGRLDYEQGKIDSVAGQPGQYRVNLEKSDGRWLVREFDDCIIRHGPDPAVAQFLTKEQCEELRTRWLHSSADPTIVPLWPLVAEARSSANRPTARRPPRRILAERMQESAIDVIGRKHVHSISVHGGENDPVYHVQLQAAVEEDRLPAAGCRLWHSNQVPEGEVFPQGSGRPRSCADAVASGNRRRLAECE